MDEQKKKIKYGIYLEPATMEKVDLKCRSIGCKSRSEFVNRAIDFYDGYLSAKEYSKYLPDVILTTIGAKQDAFEKRISSLLFKLAVEVALTQHVTVATIDVNPETFNNLRGHCVNEVKKLHGMISLEDAYNYQNGEKED